MHIKNIKNKIFKSRGFTLVETIVYVAIFSMFILSLVSFMSTMTNSRLNNQIILEVNDQGSQAMRTMTQYIRNSTAFAISNSGTKLSLTTPSGSAIFSLITGVLNMDEGSGNIPLTNNKVTVNKLSFTDLSQGVNAENIKIDLTLDSAITNSANINRSINFYGSASLRK